MFNRRAFLVSLLAPLALPFARAARAAAIAPAQKPPATPIPPVSWSCPMHAEVVDDKPGKCPICGMALQPVRLALVWSCQVHTDVTQLAAGRCRLCGRDLVRVTKALTFTCPVHRTVEVLDPGHCPTCRRTLVARYTIRPHGDHNPKHGGYFFMASNNWHVEVTHPAAAVFRLYVYNEFSRPFEPPGLAARIIEVPGAGGRTSDVSIAFARRARADYLEARVPGLALPATLAVKVRFEAGDKEYRFDFMFVDYSKEPVARPGSRGSAGTDSA
jgi:heavy metal-binding protein